jgi:hypothetical protein
MMASALRGICAMQRGVTGYDRTVWVAIGTREWLSREDSMCPPRRGVAALHLVFLLQLSPKWGMNPVICERHHGYRRVAWSHIPRDLTERRAVMRCQNERMHEKRS